MRKDIQQEGGSNTFIHDAKLAKKRKVLLVRIRQWLGRATEQELDRGFDSADVFGGINVELDGNEQQVEALALCLPSCFPQNEMPRALRQLADHERDLRRGQANDSLHKICILISRKSFIFRDKVRNARTQAWKTRAWADVRQIDKALQYQVAVYHATRAALLNLGMSDSDQRKYLIITPQDLKTTTAIAEPNARGQQHTSLSWVWRANVHKGAADDEILEEGEYHPLTL